MIQLTRLNNHPLMVNSDLIKFVEQAPDTVLTLVNGEKIVVLETSEQVLQRIVEFRRTILTGLTEPLPKLQASEPSEREPGQREPSEREPGEREPSEREPDERGPGGEMTEG